MLSAKEEAEPEEAEIEVNGLGWLRNREQRITLERLLGDERGATIEANALEDAAFLLMSALVENGYLKPAIEAEVIDPAGAKHAFTFDAQMETLLPRSLQAKRVSFNVKKGVRYRFDEVAIVGLTILPEEDAREYFVGEKVLIARGATRVYSPANLQRGLNGLEGELRRRGYAEGTVTARNVRIDERTGEVDAEIVVDEGARWEVKTLRVQDGAETVDLPEVRAFIGQPWSQYWQQDVAAAIRNHFYQLGYPDVRVRLQHEAAPATPEVQAVDVTARVVPGEQVRIGQVRLEGAEQTREHVLRRRIRSGPGDLLNPLQIDEARFRLSRLGIFDAVDLRYEPADGPVRDPVFVVREGRELEANLLFGFGSYEQLRGGVELRQFNLFGRAHQTRLLLVQSMKSTRGEYSYTLPELFGESLDATARVFGLQRQEVAFLRQEYGGNFSLSAPIHRLDANATVGYTYQSLRNQDNLLTTRGADDQQVNAASIEGSLVRDRRDNPLRPRSGYRLFAQAETASRFFGGSVDYQRVELGASYHSELGRGRWVHVGFNHGLITTFGETDDTQLPVNKRFFPGGDNSIRGY
ncbi:MAG TPA: POTRA domain-containing protein, partial [Opitutus sp.]|nr:POTRA domain-containing protein [Opitutus sp.]